MTNIIYNPALLEIELTPVMGFDTEFNSLDTLHATLICFSLTNSLGQTYVCDIREYNKNELIAFFKELGKLDKLIAHNAKVEIGIVYSNFGVLLRNCFCSMLASQCIDNGYGHKVKMEKLIEEGFKLEDGHDTTAPTYTYNMVGHIKYMQHPHGLLSCLKRYLGVVLIQQLEKKELQKSFINYKFKEPLTKAQLDYAAEDTIYLIPLHDAQVKYINERGLSNIVALENKLTPVLIKMEFRGCKIDVELHKQNVIKWQKRYDEVVLQLDGILADLKVKYPAIGSFNFNRVQTIVNQMDLFGLPKEIILSKEPFNYASLKQLQELFEACKQLQPKDESDKVSFGEESLIFYTTNNPDSDFVPFLKVLLDFREYEKLLGTYAQKLIDHLDGDRIRTSYSQCFAETCRITSSEVISKQLGLNLANIPKNPDIRKVFIPDTGFVFIDSDMTGQELVLAADFSKEPVLLKAFQEGFDHHSFLASISYSLIFGQEVEIKNQKEEITIGKYTYDIKKLRDVHKNCLFSKIYLGGPRRVQAYLNEYLVNHVEPSERFNRCKEISEALDKALKVLIKYLKGQVSLTQKQGYIVANKLGRRRYFDFPENVYGNSCNFPVQGTGADAMKIALINIDKFIENKANELNIPEQQFGFLTLTIYDQVLVNLNSRYLAYKEEISRIMGESLSYFLTTLKGTSDLNVRSFWGK